MPTVVAILIGLAVLAAVFFALRSRGKQAAPPAPQVEPSPPAKLAEKKEKVEEKQPEPAKPHVSEPPPVAAAAKSEARKAPEPIEPKAPEAAAESKPADVAPAERETAPGHTKASGGPAPAADAPASEIAPLSASEEIAPDEILETEAVEKPKAAPPPPLPSRAGMRSYSSITDESVAEEIRRESAIPKPPAPAAQAGAAPAAKVDTAMPPRRISEPKLGKVTPPARISEPKLAKVSTPPTRVSEPKLAKVSAPPAAAPEPVVAKAATPDVVTPKSDAAPKSDAKPAGASAVAKYLAPSNPATAELEKSDPRHAAARRLARISVSEIKLYHEDEVKAGREAKDLWTRMQADIGLARQTYEARIVAEVRERFDYLYDEILRQLAEGDASKLGPGAPTPGQAAEPTDEEPPTNTMARSVDAPASAPTSEPATQPNPAAKPSAAPPSAQKAEPAPAAKAEPAPAAKAEPAPAAKAEPAPAAKPTGLAARALPSNPETAELEKSDPRHAAARRLARLSVSEIKLYHEDEVKAGREAKDLWKRMQADISLATQTYEKRVDKEVRDRFDYLYDEILRQLAEGDAAKLGADAPQPKKAVADAAPATKEEPASPAPAAEAPAPAPTPVPAPAAKAEPAAAPAAKAEPAAAPAATTAASRFAPPSNPATAELEKGDPRHAAARRLARLSVSEIKLYHEDEVKAGREAKDLWKRMQADISLATQTYEKRVDKEVRDRFDYLYDEILRQLAEGDAAKLGADAPQPKSNA